MLLSRRFYSCGAEGGGRVAGGVNRNKEIKKPELFKNGTSGYSAEDKAEFPALPRPGAASLAGTQIKKDLISQLALGGIISAVRRQTRCRGAVAFNTLSLKIFRNVGLSMFFKENRKTL